MGVKNPAESDAYFKSVKKVVKKVPTKSYQHESVEITVCTFSPSVLCTKVLSPFNFLRGKFFATFSGDSNSPSNSAFFDTYIEIF
jgi:hypothetical protein